MKLMPHQVLKKLAESARNRAQFELAALSRQRQQLNTQRDSLLDHIGQIRQQREQAIRMTVQAGTLLMYDELIDDQKQQIKGLEETLKKLHTQEQELLKRWLEHSRRGKAFSSIDNKFIARANQALDRHQQQMDDDRSANRLVGGFATGI